MAWKRGVQNNQAGEIRKGQIREFLQPSSKVSSVSCRLKIIDQNSVSHSILESLDNSATSLTNSSFALVNFSDLPESFKEFIITDVTPNVLYLHAHEHPTSVITCVSNDLINHNCIALNDAHRVNSKVCIGENEEWTVYQGEQFTYDAREVSIGDTTVRSTHQCPHLDSIIFDIHLKSITPPSSDEKILNTSINAQLLRPNLLKYFCHSILTVEEIFSYHYNNIAEHSTNPIEIILSVAEVTTISPCSEDNNDIEDVEVEDTYDSIENEEFTIDSPYRGLVTEDTKIYIRIDDKYTQVLQLINNVLPPPPIPLKHVVYILTSDNECFPVKRRLLRPCLALTALVQSGRGKYSSTVSAVTSSSSSSSDAFISQTSATTIVTEVTVDTTITLGTITTPYKIDVEACTFDRVLLYLEHEARQEPFRFEPLIVSELRDAAVKLKIIGLLDTCDKVLGSFQERVRKTPIRLSEVIARNLAGTQSSMTTATNTATTTFTSATDGTVNAVITPTTTTTSTTTTGKRSETLLLLSGMVLDISRWLDEHPGGSSIIPAQALNVDSSVFFEIYHASKQSYLYLKEFYIGELAHEDLHLVQSPHATATTTDSNTNTLMSSSSPSPSPTASSSTYDHDDNKNVTIGSNGGVNSNNYNNNRNNKMSNINTAVGPSVAFIEHLAKVTTWRLKPQDMDNIYRDLIHKSF